MQNGGRYLVGEPNPFLSGYFSNCYTEVFNLPKLHEKSLEVTAYTRNVMFSIW